MIFFFFLCMFRFALHLYSRLAPKGKDQAWIHADVIEGIHADVIEGKIYFKCCNKWIKGGGINRFKQQLVVVRGNIAPWEADLKFIGEIRLELQQQFDEFEEEKAKQKEMYDH